VIFKLSHCLILLNTIANITYDRPLGILTFRYKYKNKKNFVATFLEDFEEIVMMTQAACECERILSDKKKSDISILDFDFDTLKLQYHPVNIFFFNTT
jgi:hypothetical protein